MKKRRIEFLLLMFAALLVPLPPLHGQSIQSSILGNVRDAVGAVVPNARIAGEPGHQR